MGYAFINMLIFWNLLFAFISEWGVFNLIIGMGILFYRLVILKTKDDRERIKINDKKNI